MMKINIHKLALVGILTTGLHVHAQNDGDDEVFELSPFAVTAADDVGYRATTTLAGSRVRSNIGDLGASIAVITEEFMEDTGATDGESLLSFIGSMEVGGVLGNFSNSDGGNGTVESRVNPQRGQRVRGLVSANLTRDYFQTDIPFDSYNTSRVTVNRGPNSILFGLGSPGGVINNGLKRAYIGQDTNEFSVRFGHRGSTRGTFDIGRTVIDDRLAIRVTGLMEETKYKQNPAFTEDERFYAAWDLTLSKNENSNWLGRTSMRGSFEMGEINSNPPDVIPPTDLYSSWWNGLGTQEDVNRILSVPGTDLDDINNGALTQAQVRSVLDSGIETIPDGVLSDTVTRDDFIATEGQFVPRTTIDRFKWGNPNGDDPTMGGRNSQVSRHPYFLYPAISFNSHTAQTPGWDDPLLANALDGYGIQGIMARWRPRGFNTQDMQWTNAATGGTGFTPASLRNRDVFDYHNNLWMGTTNNVNTEFDMNQVFFVQEFWNGKAGLEVALDKQTRTQYEFTPFDTGNDKGINLEITESQSPGDSDFDSFADRLANENLGRPVVFWGDNWERNRRNEQDTIRATAFASLDFADVIKNDRWGKILGKHTVTGLYEERENVDLTRQYRGSWWADNSKHPGEAAISNGLSDNFRRIVKTQVFVGPDARGFTSADQVRIDGGITTPFPKVGDEYGIWYFDNAEKTDKQAIWRIIENENPANYSKSVLESEAFSLQSTFLNGNIVALYAERTDTQESWLAPNPGGYGAAGRDGATRLDLPGTNETDGTYNKDLMYFEDAPNTVNSGDTSTKSLVVKFPEDLLFELPFGMDLQAHWYEADSFQPAGVSVNLLNQPLASPLGTTEEQGIQMTLFEGKLSIRYNDFETALANDRTNLGGGLGQVAGRIGFYLDRITSAENDTSTHLFPDGYVPDPNVTGDYADFFANRGNYTATPGSDAAMTPNTSPDNRQRISGTGADLIGAATWDAYYAAIVNAVVPSLQTINNHRVETLESGETVDLRNPQPGLNSTRDFVATGKEVDIVGQVTKNLTISANIAKQKTVTSNTGPVAIGLADEQAALLKRPLGDFSLWDLRGSPYQRESDQIGQRFENQVLRPMTLAKALDGTQLPEQREWRINVSARYDFLEGAFKNLSVGGSLRYQDTVAGGYPNLLDDSGNVIPDVANPWMGPDDISGDAFVRYRRKIMNDKVDWSIQLNARNLYRKSGDEDIPIAFNPDGSTTFVRIPVEQQWFLTNTFSF
ncbi:MAG: TonB-dependent receptor plug domain-containing protein [Opitutales bacterium]